MLVDLDEFAPDFDQSTLGVISDVSGIYHDVSGWAACPSRSDPGFDALAAECVGAATVKLLDGSRRMFAGTAAKLYEISGTTWADVSRAGDYTSSLNWRYTQFGNASLAVNGVAPVQQSITSGAFADIAGAPAAKYIDAVSGFVMLASTTDGTFGDNPDGWWCCALNNQADWTPSIATQSARGRIIDSPGGATGLRRLGDDFVFYKEDAMYVGRYQGPPIIWSWERVPGDIGTVSGDSVVVVGTVHYFLSNQGFYIFDGSIPRPIGAQIRSWFADRLNPQYKNTVKALHDTSRNLIYWFYVSNAASDDNPDECVTYNYRTNKWGRNNQTITAVLNAISSPITYDSLGALYSTYDDLPEIPYDSSFWTNTDSAPGVFGTDNKLYFLAGEPGAASITTGVMGNDINLSVVNHVVPRYATEPTTASCDYIGRDRATSTAAMSVKSGSSLVQGKFDILGHARWHQFILNSTGGMRVRSLEVDLRGGGKR